MGHALSATTLEGMSSIVEISSHTGRSRWMVVIASLLAMCVGAGPITFFPSGSFLPPMTHEFGWSRAEYFVGLSLGGILSAVAAPVVGGLGDRWGARRVLLPGIILYALANGLLATLTGNFTQYVVLSIGASVLSVVQSPTLYVKAISSRFERNRGLAIGIALSGTGIGTAAILPTVSYLIEHIGWRTGRLSLSAAVLLLAWPAVFFLFRGSELTDTPAHQSATQDGMAASQAAKTTTFWLLSAIFLLSAAAINGIVSNLVPLLHDRGASLVLAGSIVSTLAVAQIAGRIACGVMLDRVGSPRVGLLWFAFAIAGILLVGASTSEATAIAGSALMGLALGAELQLAAYYTSGFFGVKHLGRIYGVFLGCFTIGTSVGPAVIGFLFDTSHNYQSSIWAAVGGLLACCILLASISPYAFGAGRQQSMESRASSSP